MLTYVICVNLYYFIIIQFLNFRVQTCNISTTEMENYFFAPNKTKNVSILNHQTNRNYLHIRTAMKLSIWNEGIFISIKSIRCQFQMNTNRNSTDTIWFDWFLLCCCCCCCSFCPFLQSISIFFFQLILEPMQTHQRIGIWECGSIIFNFPLESTNHFLLEIHRAHWCKWHWHGLKFCASRIIIWIWFFF